MEDGPQRHADPPLLRRAITVVPLTLIAVGACIGSGIFLTPSDIAGHVGSATGIYLAWTLGGLVALSGSLTFAELAGRLPEHGGIYAYLRHSYGDFVAFMYGWVILTVITSGAIAALALASARYLSYLLPLSSTGIPLTGIALILGLTFVNLAGVRSGAGLGAWLTFLKVLGIAAIIALGFVAFLHPIRPSASLSSGFHLQGLPLALIGVFWSFGGWHHASYLAGETVEPAKTVPRAMVLGALIVTLIYLGVNWGYLQLLSPEEMSRSLAVASDAAGKILPQGSRFIAILIVLSTLGTAGIYTLSAPRIYQTMAANGTFFPALARIHPKFQVPHIAILLQAGWAIVLLVFWSTFENLIAYVVFMDWIFMVLAAFSLFLLRQRAQSYEGFKSPAYPLMPVVFLVLSVWFLGSTLVLQPKQAGIGLLLCLAGWPVFLWFKRIKSRHSSDAVDKN